MRIFPLVNSASTGEEGISSFVAFQVQTEYDGRHPALGKMHIWPCRVIFSREVILLGSFGPLTLGFDGSPQKDQCYHQSSDHDTDHTRNHDIWFFVQHWTVCYAG
jgi:hypothetical protein